MKVGDYDITIGKSVEHSYVWAIWVGAILLQKGCAKQRDQAKRDALIALVKRIEVLKTEIKFAGLEKFERKPFRAFQWTGDNSDRITNSGCAFYYKDTPICVGDWIIPETDDVISDNLFQRLFSKVDNDNR